MKPTDLAAELTIRDHIAIQIAAAAVANPGTTCPWTDDFLQREAYRFADRLIAASQPKPAVINVEV